MNDFIEIGDGVVKCKECGEPQYMPGLSSCKSMHWDSTSPLGINALRHSWKDYGLANDTPPYVCNCSEEFDSHKELMAHTAELNPTLQLEDLGRAGVGIERAAHEKTLALLKRARDLFNRKLFSSVINGVDLDILLLLDDIKEQCPVFKEEDDA